MDRKIPIAITLMVSGIFIVVPTPDELLIHPFIGFIYTRLFAIDLKTGIIWSLISYNILGMIFILISLALGGEMAMIELRNQLSQQTINLEAYVNYITKISYALSFMKYSFEENEKIATINTELYT